MEKEFMFEESTLKDFMKEGNGTETLEFSDEESKLLFDDLQEVYSELRREWMKLGDEESDPELREETKILVEKSGIVIKVYVYPSEMKNVGDVLIQVGSVGRDEAIPLLEEDFAE